MYINKFHQGSLSNNSFLVTGGAGFIGSNIVEYLMDHGAGFVRVLDNFSTGSLSNIKRYIGNPAFELIDGDICNLHTCRTALKGIQYVFHEAALGSVPRSIDDPITTNEVNISGFLNMLVASRDARAKMVYAASSSTYGDSTELPKREDNIGKPLSPYAITKYVNELYAGIFSKVYGYNVVGLRYFNVFGPRQNPRGAYAAVIPLFVDAALKGERPVINGDGHTSRDFTFVENVVQANIKAAFAPNAGKHEVYNVACGESISLNQLWEFISSEVGVSIDPLYQPERKGDVKHSLADITKICEAIGYQPVVTVREGIEKAVHWYAENSPIRITA